MPYIMGTAGHVDHGKTSLIRALTGVDCDRLDEEKRRGITIELGFAQCRLPGPNGELSVGVVDVPGHERFVKNMVAGAAGMDFVLFVIAADEGIMPQTREHLEICSLLGLKNGLVALTKVDMVDAEWLDMVTQEVREWLAGSFLAEAPIVPVSSATKQGIPELQAALANLAASIESQRRADLFRLAVDRVFTMKGHGTVVTGTAASGSVAVGDDLLIYPTGLATKARGLQSHGATVERAFAGSRTAVNLQGLDVEDISRGQILAHPDTLFPSTRWIVRLNCLPSSPRALRHRAELHIHHMASDVPGRFYFFDRDRLEPGESCLAELRFAEPMVGVTHDSFVVRAFSPLRTVAGGTVLHPLGLDMRRRAKEFPQRLELLGKLSDTALPDAERLSALLSLAGPKGLRFNELRVLADMESKPLEKLLQQLGAKGAISCFDKDERAYVDEGTLKGLCDACLDNAAKLHAKEPLKPGFARQQIAAGWSADSPPKLVHTVLERLIKAGSLAAEGDILRLSSHRVTLAADQNALRDALLKIYCEAGSAPPNLNDVLDELKLSAKEAAPMLQHLQKNRELVKINEAIFYAPEAFDKIKEALIRWFDDHDSVDLAAFKTLSGDLSRKYLIPLLEYFDKEKITMRVGDVRALRGKQ